MTDYFGAIGSIDERIDERLIDERLAAQDEQRPAWLDAPITIPLHEYVRLRVLEAQASADAECASVREELEETQKALSKCRREWLDEMSKRENAEAECRRLNAHIDEITGNVL